MPLVSVGLPLYNAERYLTIALDSVLAQTHTDLEVVISDNGSADATEEICRSYAAADGRIRYSRQDVNRGAAWNHNAVVHTARGDYFRWYSYDDQLKPTLVEKCLTVLLDAPETILAFPETTVVDDNGAWIEDYRNDLPWQADTPSGRLAGLLVPKKIDSLLCWCYPIYGLMRRDVLLSTGLLGSYNGADDVLLVELALRGEWVQVPERLFLSRRHAKSSVGGQTPEQVAHWFDPDAPEAPPMVQASLLRGYLRAVARAPITSAEKYRCYRIVARWLANERNGRVIAHELRRNSRLAVRRAVNSWSSRRNPAPGSPGHG